MNIEELKDFINNSSIPEVKAMPKTFLGIAKQPHYENVLSNLYAFYFDVEEEHGFNSLFINSLMKLINKQKKEFRFSHSFSIERESKTDDKGRIDLVFQSDNEAILIENKVYHHIKNNDFDDYWNSVKANNKLGIILSLKSISQNKDNFINITHIELFNEIFRNIGSYLLNSDNKYLIFLKDIYQNIINLTNSMDENQIQFYYKNQEKINDIVSINNNIVEHVKKEVETACELIDKKLRLDAKRSNRLRYYHSPLVPNLMFTVLFESFLAKGKSIWIIVELKDKLLKRKEELKSITFSEEEKKILNNNFNSDTSTAWAHFASWEYAIEEKKLLNLSSFIAKTIGNDGFLSIFEKLEKVLSE